MNIYQRNYEAIVKRGLITKDTDDLDFWFKVCEEKDEVLQALRKKDEANLNEEITDLMNVCNNWLMHKGIDPEKALEKCAIKNEKRIKKWHEIHKKYIIAERIFNTNGSLSGTLLACKKCGKSKSIKDGKENN